jgi:RNA polymerase sigma-70 factor (ECF subfamily)
MVAQSLDRSAAEEITQDVFLTVWQKAHTYDPGRGAVRPWLLQIAHSRVLNELRRRGRRPRLVPDPDETQLGAVPDDAPQPDEEAWRDYRRAAIAAAVDALPPSQRQALSLAFFEDLTQQQVAAYLGLPLGTAKTRIRAGMQRLRVSLLPVVASVTLAITGGLAALGIRYHQQQEMVQRQDRALGIVASSDATAVRLTAAPGVPSQTHSTYRTRPGADLAIMTFSNFAPAPAGHVYQAWARDGGAWRSLGVVTLDANGHALAIVDQPGDHAPQAMQVTLEPAGGSAAPTGPVMVAWSAS